MSLVVKGLTKQLLFLDFSADNSYNMFYQDSLHEFLFYLVLIVPVQSKVELVKVGH